MGPGTGGGGGGSGGPSGGGGQQTCTTRPCRAALLGDVGFTTVAGGGHAVGENIYGPYENGFGARQDGIIGALGCSSASLGYVDGGLDTHTAEQMVAHQCGIALPRTEGGRYIGMLDEGGGHGGGDFYHFHERLTDLWRNDAATGHSTQAGKEAASSADGATHLLYGKWENASTQELLKLDACGGHFGATPDSGCQVVYHYHVQDRAPFTFGCFGPDADASGNEQLVTLEKCRSLYAAECSSATNLVTVKTARNPDGVQYRKWCPCFDGVGSSVGAALVGHGLVSDALLLTK